MARPDTTIIIGGGQAALAMSHHLAQVGREHIIFGTEAPGSDRICMTCTGADAAATQRIGEL